MNYTYRLSHQWISPNLWQDLGIIVVGTAFFIMRTIGLHTANSNTSDIAFDILAVEALFLVPR
jgi:hypothetical protein